MLVYIKANEPFQYAIVFRKWIGEVQNTMTYNEWSDDEKSQLKTAFKHAWSWLLVGSTDYAQKPYPGWVSNGTVGGNLADPKVNSGATTLWDYPTAWNWYLVHLSFALVMEIKGLIPWTVRSMDHLNQLRVLSGGYFTWPAKQQGGDVKGYQPMSYYGTPAHPAYMWKWFQANGVLGEAKVVGSPGGPFDPATKDAVKRVVSKVIDFARWKFYHFLGVTSWSNAGNFWGYRIPAVSQLVEGTKTTHPDLKPWWNESISWTAGCYGSSAFYQQALRSLNIPVEIVANDSTCFHTTVYFPQIDTYLSHGDDPYSNTRGFGNYVAPASLLLVEGPKWRKWFFSGNTTESCKNVGRASKELEIEYGYLSAETFGRYCLDLANGFPFGGVGASLVALKNGTVSKSWPFTYIANGGIEYRNMWSVEELQQKGLWTKLEQLRVLVGGCGNAPKCWSSPCYTAGDTNCALCTV